jgi:exosortase
MGADADNLIASEATRIEPGRAVGSLALEVGGAVLLGLLGLVAYRHLIGYEPSHGPIRGLQGVEGMLFAPSGSSPWLVFGGAGWLFARRARRIRSALGAPGRPLLAILLFAPAAALCVWSYYVQEPTLLLPSLSLSILACALWLGGGTAFRATALPACFLLFAVPIPPVVLNRFIYPLQVATSHSTAAILDACGLSTFASGDRIYRAERVFEVIESCSGVRTIETLLMSSFLYHDLFYRNRLQSALIVVSSVLIGLLVNQLRVISIVLNPLSSFSAVHTAQGLVMIVLGVLMLAGVDRLLSAVLPRRPWWRRPRLQRPVPVGRLAGAALGLAALAAATVWTRPWVASHIEGPALATVPIQLDGWKGSGVALDREFLGSTTFSEWVHRRYDRGSDSIDVLIGANARLDSRIDFGSLKVAVPGSGWQITDRGTKRLPTGRDVQRVLLRGPRGEELAYVWTYGVASPLDEIVRSVLALDRGPLRRPGRAIVVRLATPASGDLEDAESRLQGFAAAVDHEMDHIAGRGAT